MRKLLVACLALTLVLAGGLMALVGPRHCPVNRAALGRIERHMTRAEAYAVLGGPPGDYRTRPAAEPQWWGGYSMCSWVNRIEEWEGDEGTARVSYYRPDGAGIEKVSVVEFRDATPYRAGPLEQGRWRFVKLKETWLP